MNRIRKNINAVRIPPYRSHGRRGTVFHYYMVYLLLTGMLTTTAGLFLNSVLKADRSDAEASRYLSTLLRLEQALRRDASESVSLQCSDLQLTCKPASGSLLTQWDVEGNVVFRRQREMDEVRTSDRFVFRKGTSLQFRSDPDRVLVRLILQEPSRLPSSGIESGNSEIVPLQTLEIMLVPQATPSSTNVPADSETSDGATT